MSICDSFRSAVSERLFDLHGEDIRNTDNRNYTIDCESGLIPGVSRDDFWTDLSQGNGGELIGKPPRPPKFCAAHSSAKLAVNSFGPFRYDTSRLVLAEQSGFEIAQFEKKLRNGLRGTPPNLDFFACGADSIVAVESKFTEWLTPKAADFAEVYRGAVSRLADSQWASVFEALVDDPSHSNHLDAAQLVKHYLGMRHSLRGFPQRQILLYVYWEPANADEFDECSCHRRSLDDFADRVSGSEIGFQHMSYAQLWDGWLGECRWNGIREHVSNLRRQYELPVRTDAAQQSETAVPR